MVRVFITKSKPAYFLPPKLWEISRFGNIIANMKTTMVGARDKHDKVTVRLQNIYEPQCRIRVVLESMDCTQFFSLPKREQSLLHYSHCNWDWKSLMTKNAGFLPWQRPVPKTKQYCNQQKGIKLMKDLHFKYRTNLFYNMRQSCAPRTFCRIYQARSEAYCCS